MITKKKHGFKWNNSAVGMFVYPLTFIPLSGVLYLLSYVSGNMTAQVMWKYCLFVFMPAFMIIGLTVYYAQGNIESHSQTPSESQR